MATTARLDLSVWRNDDVYDLPIRIIGPDLSGSAWAAQIRLAPDTPGNPLVNLPQVTTAIEGIRRVSSGMVDGRFVNEFRLRIDLATRQALPYAGEVGDSAVLAWAFALNGVTRLVGDVIVLAHTLGSNGAPTNRPSGDGRSAAAYPSASATLTIAGDDIVSLTIDGSDEIGALIVEASEAADRAEAAAASISGQIVAGDNELPRVVVGAALNSANPILRRDAVMAGFSVPIGKHGLNSYIQPRFPVDGAGLAGSVVHIKLTATMSATFTRALTHFVSIVRTGGTPAVDIVQSYNVSGTQITWEFDYTLQADDRQIAPTLQTTSDTNVSAVESLQITFTSMEYLTSTDPLRSVGELNRGVFRERLVSDISATIAAGGPAPTIVTVKVDGGGDFTSVGAAIDSITDASAGKPYEVVMYPGVDSVTRNVITKDYVDVRGIDRDRCVLQFYNPDNIAAQNAKQDCLFYHYANSTLDSLTMRVKNAEYVLHVDDNNNGSGNNRRTGIVRCTVIHEGNYGAQAYQTSIGADAAAVAGRFAMGTGVSSGMELLIDDVDAIGPWGGGFGFHNNINATRPGRVLIRNSRTVATEAGRFEGFNPLGSGQNDSVVYEGVENATGRLVYSTIPWLDPSPDYQPADHTEIAPSGYGNGPSAFQMKDIGRALRITSSSTTSASRVEIEAGGSALARIFGTVQTKRGGAGLAGAVYGSRDVSGTEYGTPTMKLNGLGYRLGNCATSPKSFRVRFQGGTYITVNFTTNLTPANDTPEAIAASNAAVLAIINSALGSAGTADLWAVANETRRPRYRDEERTLRNATSSAILRRTVLEFADDANSVRPMTNGRFAGVAWQDILAGDAGRVKTRGWLALEDLWVKAGEVNAGDLGADPNVTPLLAFGNSFGIDPTQAGRLIKNGGGLLQVMLTAVAVSGLSTAHEVRP
jgi:hypothetical protein